MLSNNNHDKDSSSKRKFSFVGLVMLLLTTVCVFKYTGYGYTDAATGELIISERDIQFAAEVVRSTDTINTKPYGVAGYQLLYRSSEIMGQEVRVTKETVTERSTFVYFESRNGIQGGWIDKNALKIEKIESTKYVEYNAIVTRGIDTVNTEPFGVEGYKTLYRSGEILGEEVHVTKEAVTGRATFVYFETNSGKQGGWIDKRGLKVIEVVESTIDVDYKAVVSRSTDTVNTKPYGIDGFQTLYRSSEILGKEVHVTKESVTTRATFVYFESIDGMQGGWIDKSGVTFSENSQGFGLNGSVNEAGDSVNLGWYSPDKVEPYTYQVYSKKPNYKDFQTISTTDLNKEVRVLNVYPLKSTTTDIVTYTNSKGETKTVHKSASAEMWMEESNSENSKGYGMGLIDVDPLNIDDFNVNPMSYLKDANGEWAYDVVFFGSWDNNASKDISQLARNATEEFIQSGRGVLFGHDVLKRDGLNQFTSLRSYVNIKLLYRDDVADGFERLGSTRVQLKSKGLLTTHPWDIGTVGDYLDVPYTHTSWQVALGDVPIEFVGYTDPNYNIHPTWNGGVVSDSSGNGTNNFYLATWNNTAMIQTGHSKGSATPDEQKILANTLFYLAQLTTNTSLKDQSAMDAYAPEFVTKEHTITRGTTNVTVDFSDAKEIDTPFEYYVEATGQNTGNKKTSETIQVSNVSGLAGYSTVIDSNPTTVPDSTVDTTNSTITTPKETGTSKYVHVVAVDKKGNKSEPLHIKLDSTKPTLKVTKDTEDWVNGEVTLSVFIEDLGSGLNVLTRPDGTVVNKNGVVEADHWVTVNTNGEYTFTVTDMAGNESTKVIDITNIDKQEPTVSIKGIPEGYTDEDTVELIVTGIDDISGIKSITLPNKEVVNESSTTYSVNKNGDYEFIITDNAGNVFTETVTVTQIKIPYTFYLYDSKGDPIEGAGFDLMRDGTKYADAVSDSSGLVDFGKVPADGKYTIKQTKAPEGHIIDPNEKEVDVDDNTDPEEFISHPRGKELPATGVKSTLVIGCLVVVLGVISVSLFIIKKVGVKK